MKKLNNKGFSLVELIIVIAIMAILVGIMAPSLMRYIEKSRYSSDVQTIDSAFSALKYALADEDAYLEVVNLSGSTFTFQDLIAGSVANTTNLTREAKETFNSDTVTFKSKAFNGQDINVTVSGNNFEIKVTSSDSAYKDVELP